MQKLRFDFGIGNSEYKHRFPFFVPIVSVYFVFILYIFSIIYLLFAVASSDCLLNASCCGSSRGKNPFIQ